MKFFVVSYDVVIVLTLPEITGSAQHSICLVSNVRLPGMQNLCQRPFWTENNVHVIRHDTPCVQQIAASTPMFDRVDGQGCDSLVLQPAFAVAAVQELINGVFIPLCCLDVQKDVLRQAACQPESDEVYGVLSLKMREAATRAPRSFIFVRGAGVAAKHYKLIVIQAYWDQQVLPAGRRRYVNNRSSWCLRPCCSSRPSARRISAESTPP